MGELGHLQFAIQQKGIADTHYLSSLKDNLNTVIPIWTSPRLQDHRIKGIGYTIIFHLAI